MIHHLLLSIALIAVLLLCIGPAHAQQTSSTSGNAKSQDAVLREKAFKLLESLAGELSTLQSGENRARLGSNIAASLWNYDEKRARTLFISVEEEIKAGLQSGRSDDRRDQPTLLVFLRLRMDTVERIAKHDPEFAYEFLKATELNSDKSRPSDIVEAERAIELRLARQIAANSPDLALKLGRRSLAQGFDHNLLPILSELHRKRREQGVILYKEVIVKLRQANLAEDWNATFFARALVDFVTPPLVDDSAFRELINIFITTAFANGCDKASTEDSPDFCGHVPSLFQHIEKIDPLRAAQLKQWAPSDEETGGMPYSAYQEMTDLNQNGTVDEILSLAAKYPGMEGHIRWQALMKAQASGDLEQARKIAANYEGDPDYRKRMLAEVEQAQMWQSITAEQIAEVQQKLSTIPRMHERVNVLLALADRIGANDRKTALMLLNQASAIIDTMKPDKEQTEAQIALASMYSLERSDRGLAIMESLLLKLNELIAAAMKLDGYDNRYLRDGEWNMTGEGGLGSLLTRLANNAGYFAWSDFDRAVSVAAQFERPEIRIMAQLKLAQGILAGPPKRLAIMAPRLHTFQ